MDPTVEFLFDFGSPNAYLAHLVVPAVERRTGVPFRRVPVLLGGIFKATGNASPAVTMASIRNKLEYETLEMRRFLSRHAIAAFEMNPHFPVNTLQLMRGVVAATRLGCVERYTDEVFRHMWANPKKMDDPDILRAALEESALPAGPLLESMRDPEVKSELVHNTERAVERGVFGAPSFFVGDELYFGKDRLRDVEDAILTARGEGWRSKEER